MSFQKKYMLIFKSFLFYWKIQNLSNFLQKRDTICNVLFTNSVFRNESGF